MFSNCDSSGNGLNMKYRVQCDLAFDDEITARKIFDRIKEAKANNELKDVSPREKYSSNIHKCYHDETPTKPCETIEKIESELIIKEKI